jgi:hypothetical protein
MAFDLTKPSMTGATLVGEFGNIRENFRAIVQGDSSVFSKMWITASVPELVLEVTGQPKARFLGITDTSRPAASLSVNADYNGSSWNRDNTGDVAWLAQVHATDSFKILRAAAAANPITWTTLFTIDGGGKVGIGRTPTTTLFEVAGTITTVHPAAATSNSIASIGTTTAPNYWNIQNTGSSVVLGVESSAGGALMTGAGAYAGVLYVGNTALQFGTNATARLTLTSTGSVVMGTAALATNATDGFFYLDSCAGTPTGTPTAVTGRVPLIYDTTNNKLYAYNGAWKSVTLT